MKSGYLDRALQSEDPRFADLLRRLGHEEVAEQAPADKDEPAPKRAKKAAATKTARTYKRRDMKAEK